MLVALLGAYWNKAPVAQDWRALHARRPRVRQPHPFGLANSAIAHTLRRLLPVALTARWEAMSRPATPPATTTSR